MIVPGLQLSSSRRRFRSSPPPRPVTVRQLRDRRDAFVSEFPPFFCSDGAEQGQVVPFDRDATAARLVFAGRAMRVQHRSGRGWRFCGCYDGVEDFSRLRKQAHDVDALQPKVLAVYNVPGGWRRPARLLGNRQGGEGDQKLVRLVEPFPGRIQDRDDLMAAERHAVGAKPGRAHRFVGGPTRWIRRRWAMLHPQRRQRGRRCRCLVCIG